MEEIEQHRPSEETHDKITELVEIRGEETHGKIAELEAFRETAMYKHLLTEMCEHYALRVKTQGNQVRAYMSEKTQEKRVAP